MLMTIVELLNKWTVSWIQISKKWQRCYVIIKLSESKTTKGAFKYYTITEGVGVFYALHMLMHAYAFAWLRGMGRGLALWWHKLISFLQISGFSLTECEQLLRQCDFIKQLLVQNELILNLWMKWMKPVFDTTFF